MSELPKLAPEDERKFQIFYAKVMLREARARRHTIGGAQGFHAILLAGAARARQAAAAIDPTPPQKDLFA